jgi:superoxide reductase
MKVFVCPVCGHIEFGAAPQYCPICHVPAEKFAQNDNIFKDAEAKSKEAAIKHIPDITINKKCGLIPESACTDVTVRIGKTLHPMEEKHYIVFVDCYIDYKFVSRMYLSPGVNAAGCFHIKYTGAKVTIVELCNVHGHWMAEADLA